MSSFDLHPEEEAELQRRAERCTTHSFACDCREEQFRQMRKAARAVIEMLDARRITLYGAADAFTEKVERLRETLG